MEPQEAEAIRKKLDLSQKELAKLVLTSQGNISKWESGEVKLGSGARLMMYKAFAFIIKINRHKQFMSWLKK